MSRDKIAVALKNAMGWSYTKALHFRRSDTNKALAGELVKEGETYLDAWIQVAKAEEPGFPPDR